MMCNTRFAWAVRVAYFNVGQRRPECEVSQCGNPLFMTFNYDYTGNRSLLDRPTVAFFASRIVTPAIHEEALQWARLCCTSDRVVMSGFQSPLEKAVFHLLLEARHPVIWGLGRMLYRRYPPEIERALAEERILIFAVRNVRRTGWHTAQIRNFTLATLADEEVYAVNEEGRISTLDVLCRLEEGTKPVRIISQATFRILKDQADVKQYFADKDLSLHN